MQILMRKSRKREFNKKQTIQIKKNVSLMQILMLELIKLIVALDDGCGNN